MASRPWTDAKKNFIVYIANGQSGPANSESELALAALNSTQVGANTTQTTKISTKVTFDPAPTCGATTQVAGTNANDWSQNWADEWARLMFEQDGGATTAEGKQNIITYTVGVVNETTNPTCKPDYPALLTSMADYGGGNYFKVSSAAEIAIALGKILNEVQAVNSVFSSASLPVSVNAEGSYLNQIYLGMFRPDSSGSPRWMGNLKQYQLMKAGNALVLGDNDSTPKAAINPTTGFISPNAVSFWTSMDTSTEPDSTGGFFKNDKKGVPESGYDKPDGEVVEKGGVAQQIRLKNLTSTFDGAAGTTVNPRKLYTYCPGGGTCAAALTNAANEFSTANANIPTTAFGSSTTVPISSIVRTGTTAVVTTSGQHGFGPDTVVTISNANQNEYNVTQTISSVTPTTFNITGLPVSTTTPATGNHMQAYSATTPPDKATVIRWLRGEDNYGDEKGPGGTVKVRPSVHGDVLHSRPLVVNYGDSRGIVVFYGANDGVFRAVNGNQSSAISGVPAGGELWGLVLKEHYDKVNRQRLASPEMKFPGTLLSTARPKDYFVDGGTGAYQKLKPDGSTIDTAYLYLTMRRGGRFMYALDVSDPIEPVVKWKIDNTKSGFEELGQTWSRPRATLVQGGGLGTAPVLIFGAGYDPAQDAEPPGTDSMGRGIYVVNALTGNLIWSANSTCTTSATCRNVPGMTYAIPSDIAFVDRDGNGYIDKLYFGDLGGNIWRADVAAASTSDWTVTKLAALGCDSGVCASGTTPRKFFFPPAIMTVKTALDPTSFDAVSLASGDREHPLKSTATGSSYNVRDKFFMIMDRGTSVNQTITANVTPVTLFDATSAEYIEDGTLNGFYRSLATGEKAVNAPTAVNGLVYFATNRPIDRTNTCMANLGEAKAYAVSPFLGTASSNVLTGGGLPPSAVAGVISIVTKRDSDGKPKEISEEKFCIGCGVTPPGQPPCSSALENCIPITSIPRNLRRTYWYKK